MTTRFLPVRLVVSIALEMLTLNFLWEMGQARFYASMKGLPFWSATTLCARAAAADVGLLALCFVGAALMARDATWPLHPKAVSVATYLVLCLVATIAIERWALATARWSYGVAMPTIFGVGALPLLQWIVIPALSIFIFRSVFRKTLR
ncbi:MAG: hypothetical protein ABI837_06250 [Acidobacteriota bacterium]